MYWRFTLTFDGCFHDKSTIDSNSSGCLMLHRPYKVHKPKVKVAISKRQTYDFRTRIALSMKTAIHKTFSTLFVKSHKWAPGFLMTSALRNTVVIAVVLVWVLTTWLTSWIEVKNFLEWNQCVSWKFVDLEHPTGFDADGPD